MCECNQICVWNERHIGCQKPIDELCPLSNVAPTEKTLTNADRIRAMSDEELAEWLEWFVIATVEASGMQHDDFEDEEREKLLALLKQPAEEE